VWCCVCVLVCASEREKQKGLPAAEEKEIGTGKQNDRKSATGEKSIEIFNVHTSNSSRTNSREERPKMEGHSSKNIPFQIRRGVCEFVLYVLLR